MKRGGSVHEIGEHDGEFRAEFAPGVQAEFLRTGGLGHVRVGDLLAVAEGHGAGCGSHGVQAGLDWPFALF